MELSEFKANEGKQVNIQVGDRTFARHAIATHFVQVGESYMDLIQKYVVPIYQEGDILSSSEKIISLCQKRIVRKSDMKLSWLAKFLSKFASPLLCRHRGGLPLEDAVRHRPAGGTVRHLGGPSAPALASSSASGGCSTRW